MVPDCLYRFQTDVMQQELELPSACLTASPVAPGLSARERNKLKRKTRALQRSSSAEGSSKRAKTGNEAADAAVEQAEAEEDSQEWLAVAAGQWPFQGICDQMCTDVLDPVWEVSSLAAGLITHILLSSLANFSLASTQTSRLAYCCVSAHNEGKYIMHAYMRL